jgi:pimeloyl-ACP methyl ester carboxylesterase
MINRRDVCYRELNMKFITQRKVHTVLTSLALAVALPTMSAMAAPGVSAADACGKLSSVKLENTTIESAVEVAAGSTVKNEFPPSESAPLPAHCLVRGEIGHHMGADGHPYGNKFELRLPKDWSGRLLFQGGGGLDGVVRPAVGMVVMDPTAHIDMALARGYAVVSTDAGHDQSTLKSPGDFGADPQALADYTFNSTKVVTAAAQRLVKSYYKRASTHTYFMGCSEGGREGLIAAQRYPEVFDGVVAGAPAFHLSRAFVAEAWNSQAYAAVAPAAPNGMPNISQALTDQELKTLSDAVLAKCDALDGLRDGSINDPMACGFDPETIRCPSAQGKECLAAEKVAAIKKVFDGPKNSAGQALYSNWLYDSGVSEFGWRLWMLGNGQMPAINVMIAPAAINGLALGNQAPAIDIFRMNFESDVARIDAGARSLNATSIDYAGFRRRNGKLLLYSGVSDPIFSAADLVRYYESVPDSKEFSRLFLVPGMNHCGGGKATDQFDSLSAIQRWVEEGKAPERIVARGAAFPGRTRPLCPYPSVARYQGGADVDSEASFECKR